MIALHSLLRRNHKGQFCTCHNFYRPQLATASPMPTGPFCLMILVSSRSLSPGSTFPLNLQFINRAQNRQFFLYSLLYLRLLPLRPEPVPRWSKLLGINWFTWKMTFEKILPERNTFITNGKYSLVHSPRWYQLVKKDVCEE